LTDVAATQLDPLIELVEKLPKVRLLRSPIRLGLMKARVIGCTEAKGPVLVVMDAHVEVAMGWLQPLLDPIARDPHTITVPDIDALDKDTLGFNFVFRIGYGHVGGFSWRLLHGFERIDVGDDETLKPTPTMLGAAFAIRKDYFEHLGYYDPGFELWGGENLELSFKVWMCGGQMVQAFCSHVGHMYRKVPYLVSNQLKRQIMTQVSSHLGRH
jgi:polypeptide N-acetylgalactosaminyltransferase